MANLMDDLAKDIHTYLLEVSTDFEGNHLVMIPITEVVKKFGRNQKNFRIFINFKISKVYYFFLTSTFFFKFKKKIAF